MGFVEYVDEISPLGCVPAVFVRRFVSQPQLRADGGRAGARGSFDIHQES